MATSHTTVWTVFAATFLAAASAPAQVRNDDGSAQQHLPSAFAENKGQWNPEARYLARIGGLDAWVTDNGIVYDFYKRVQPQTPSGPSTDLLAEHQRLLDASHRKGHVVRMAFVNSSGSATASDLQTQSGYQNYFIGNDSTRWAANVRLFNEVSIQHLYDGVDARIAFDGGSVRYDLIVAPGADAGSIAMRFVGADGVRVNDAGELVLRTSIGDVTQRNLVAYQIMDGVKQTTPCRFEVRRNGTVGFVLGKYDRSLPLVIDPLVYSTYLGSSEDCYGGAVAVDRSGNAYLTGVVYSSGYPTTVGAYDRTHHGGSDIVVTKMNSTGNALIYSTYIGGSSNDLETAFGNAICGAIALDADGNAYVALSTSSDDYPVTAGAYDGSYNGGTDIAITKLNPTGSALLYSTYLGGSGYDGYASLTVDASRNVYVAASSRSSDFPVTSGAFINAYRGGLYDGIVCKVSPDGSTLTYSTYLGGGNTDIASGIAVDGNGNTYITGTTMSVDFPVTPGAFQSSLNSSTDAFVCKLNPTGTALIYSTYFGGNNVDGANGIAVSRNGNAYIVGPTISTTLPTTPSAYQSKILNSASVSGPSPSIFVTELNPAGSALVYCTYISATLATQPYSMALNDLGNVALTGITYALDYPVTPDALSSVNKRGVYDAFVTILNSSGSALLYSTYLSGTGWEDGLGAAFDVTGNLYVGGSTASTDFPTTNGAYDQTYNGQTDFFLLKLGRCTITADAGPDKEVCAGESVSIDARPSTNGLAPYTYSWSPSAGLSNPNILNPMASPSTTTDYILTAIDNAGCIGIDTVRVMVLDAPLINAGRDTTICAGTSVVIGSTAIGTAPPFTYLWRPSVGLNRSDIPTPTATPTTSTQYVVAVTDTKGCVGYDTVVVSVRQGPIVNFSSSLDICPGDSAIIGGVATGGAGPYSYHWTPSTGLSNPDTATPQASPASTTIYSLVVTDASGCTTTKSVTVNVGSTLKTSIAVNGSLTLCRDDSVTLDAGPFATYLWSNGATTRMITVRDTGYYSVDITNGKGCSGGSDTVHITFAPSVNAKILGPITVCSNSTIDYTAQPDTAATFDWMLIGSHGTIVGGAGSSRINVKWGAAGVDTIMLRVTTASGCSDSTMLVVSIGSNLKPVITPNGSIDLCDGDSISLDAGSGYASYLWSSGEATQSIVVKTAGSYAVTVVDPNGCSGTSDSVHITIAPAPNPRITPDGPITLCEGDSIELAAPPGFNGYAWSNGMTSRTISVKSAGVYYVTVVNAAGCRGTSQDVVVTVRPSPTKPSITVSGDTLISSPALSYQWSRNDTVIVGAIDQRYVRRQSGSYTVTITDANGCRSTSDPATAIARVVWMDTVSARVGQRVRLHFIVEPALSTGDGVIGYNVRLNVNPKSLFAHQVLSPLSALPPQMTFQRNGTILINYISGAAIVGDTLFDLELEGLVTGQPLNDVIIEQALLNNAASTVIGNGLVILSGCDIARGLSLDKAITLESVRPNPVTDEAMIVYRAPQGSTPRLIVADIAGREVLVQELEVGTGEEQVLRLSVDDLGSGVYRFELHDRGERSALPVVIVR